ncbi:hypothetical protein GJ744_009049 [Endocarpon pusillum]|uniref:Ankyrin repeat protein n=1 Tax=Endocarpon pusillum TaxID=364733 RepID=A0A8H7AKJ5_9EURO|nr:hypothetical protein GJ744_009049 [Endocarpon pusillum]
MAYVGNTARLCQAIVDGDLEHVEDWCKQEGADVNRRDHTGRAPLHLATMSSTPEIVQCLIDHGARLVARLVDGFTSLHIASRRGNTTMVKAILDKSEANEEEEARKEDLKKEARRADKEAKGNDRGLTFEDIEMTERNDDSENEVFMEDSDSVDSDRMTEGSFVKVPGPNEDSATPDSYNENEPDVYDVNVLAWDYPVSPLHLAIMGGHVEVIELLVSTFGADVLLPVKLVNDHNKSPRAAILALVLALQLPLLEACKTTEKLLAGGASSTQADLHGFSALQYVVNSGNTEILDILLKFDEPAAKMAVNHLTISGWEHNAEVISPLLTAIRGRHVTMVDKLLELGAEHSIQREVFVRAYHRTFEHASQDPEDMKKAYEATIEQPIITAIKCDLPKVAQKLLELGADVNVLRKGAYRRAYHPSTTGYGETKSLLDLVQDQAKLLKEYKGDKKAVVDPPAALEQDEFYLQGLQKGTYRYWLAVHDLAQARSLHDWQRKWYQESLERTGTPWEGTREKMVAIAEALSDYEAVEKALVARGARTFRELYPDLKENQRPQSWGSCGEASQKKEPYTTTHKFLVPDLTEVKMDGYFQLFEAAWKGDISTVKSLTLAAWGGLYEPLQIAVKDLQGFSPLSIAVLRGHSDLAKVVVEISAVQYQPNEKKDQYRYTVRPYDEDESEMDRDDDSEYVNVVSELVDNDYTVNDITALAGRIGSKVSPVQLLTWHSEIWRALENSINDVAAAKKSLMPGSLNVSPGYLWSPPKTSWPYFHDLWDMESNRCRWSLIRYTIAKNDMAMLNFLTEIGNGLARSKADDESLKVFTCSKSDFDLAVRLGRTEMIGHFLAATGACLPLQKLVDTSGVVIQEKPKYYQGLSVYGKKRKDWAEWGRGLMRAPLKEAVPPLLSVIFEGNLESTEYFLGDAPLRRYKEFAAANKDDKRIRVLDLAEGGIDQVLSKWLTDRNHIAIHMAVMAKPRKDGSNPTLEFLIRHMPEAIDAKSSTGITPLQLAFQLDRLYAAKTLIAAGANQATRNRMGENLLHTILNADISSEPKVLRAALGLLEPSLIPTMLLERCSSTGVGSLTPLAFWIHNSAVDDTDAEVVQVLLEYSKGADLEIMDGAGDYPLHHLVRGDRSNLIEGIISYNPSLLYKENAMGMTVLDIVDNVYLRDRMDHPPSAERHSHATSFVHLDPARFLPENRNKVSESNAVKNWRIVHEAARLRPGRRQLVSLSDANEVAKRLAAQQREKSAQRADAGGRYNEYVRSKEGDEFEQWIGRAQGFRPWDLERFSNESIEKRGKEEEVVGNGASDSRKRSSTPEESDEEVDWWEMEPMTPGRDPPRRKRVMRRWSDVTDPVNAHTLSGL